MKFSKEHKKQLEYYSYVIDCAIRIVKENLILDFPFRLEQLVSLKCEIEEGLKVIDTEFVDIFVGPYVGTAMGYIKRDLLILPFDFYSEENYERNIKLDIFLTDVS